MIENLFKKIVFLVLRLIQLMNKAIEQLHFDLSQHSFHRHITLIDQGLEIILFYHSIQDIFRYLVKYNFDNFDQLLHQFLLNIVNLDYSQIHVPDLYHPSNTKSINSTFFFIS